MKDVHNKEIKAGDICHIIWRNPEGPPVDVLATAVRTRGRGIKFITDDEKSITVDELNSVEATVIITSRNSGQETEQTVKTKGGLSQEEVQIIEKLKSFGWSGTITKDTNSIGYKVTLN